MTTRIEMRRARLHLKVEASRCDLCGFCVSLCPARSLEVKELSLTVDEERCVYCLACVLLCPRRALSFEVSYEPGHCFVEGVEEVRAPWPSGRRPHRRCSSSG